MNDLDLRKATLHSALAHLVVLLLLAVLPTLPVFSPKLKVIWVELPKGSSETIDTNIKEAKDLPQSTIQEQKQVEEVQKPKETPMVQPKPLAKPKPAEKKLTPQEKKMKEALAAIDKKLKQRKVTPEAAQVKDKGEGFKYGTGSEALKVPPTDPEYLGYQAKLRAKIMQEWILPQAYLSGPNPPKASLVVLMDKGGEIVSTQWEQPSGNPAFDSSCMRAVQRASPLPIPPQRLEWEAYHEGFLIDFDPGLKQ